MNKLHSLSHCKNEWAILLDADNFLTQGYLDAIFKEDWNNNFIYAPCWSHTFHR